MTFHLGKRRFLRSAADDGPRGTYDFKWISGDEVRIALLDERHSGRHEYALGLLEECARRWLVRGHARVNLNVTVNPDYLSKEGGPDKRYDVLATCPRKGQAHGGGVLDHAGRTQIGSYARRDDYLSPTLFLPLEGPEKGWKPGQDFLTEDLVAGMHEMGHVLGLPHAHQSPILCFDDYWQPASSPAYLDWFAQFGPPVPTQTEIAAFIDGDLRSLPWGNLENSHWWPFAPNECVDSIMTYPLIDDCLSVLDGGRIFGPLMPSGHVASPTPPELEYWTRPTEADWRLLVEMYGRKCDAAS